MSAKDPIRRRLALLLVIGASAIAADWTSPAVALTNGALVKGNGPAVYYVSDDRTRHVFPSEAVFDSWYAGTGISVKNVPESQLSVLPLGDNMVFKPGVKLIKITTDPKVYAVSRYGVIHWVTSESLAATVYGADWRRSVMDVPDVYFVDYKVGTPIIIPEEYDPQKEMASAVSPQANFDMSDNVGDGWLSDQQKRRIVQIVSLLENSMTEIQYAYVENLGDGRGYTAGRAGFTTANGDAYLVVQRYASISPQNVLAKYLPRMKQLADTESDSTVGLEGYPAAWAAAASNVRFREAQDEITDELYYVPAMLEADNLGLKSPLGRGIIFDSIIQHGGGDGPDSLSALISRTTSAEKGTPATGIDEVDWLRAFLGVRRDDLSFAHDPETRDAWSESVGRLDVWSGILDSGNMNLAGPIDIRTEDYQATID